MALLNTLLPSCLVWSLKSIERDIYDQSKIMPRLTIVARLASRELTKASLLSLILLSPGLHTKHLVQWCPQLNFMQITLSRSTLSLDPCELGQSANHAKKKSYKKTNEKIVIRKKKLLKAYRCTWVFNPGFVQSWKVLEFQFCLKSP